MHLPYSASSTARWLACPGSVKASKGVPEYAGESSKYSQSGTELHALAAAAINSNDHTHADPTVRMYVEYIAYLRATYILLAEWVEQLTPHADIPDLGGTPDYACMYVNEEGRACLHVVDFKSGAGTIVDVNGNEQLLTYAACLTSQMPFVDVDSFRLTIVQPQSYRDGDEITTDIVDPAQVSDHLACIILATQQDHFVTGNHCRYCPVRANCTALADDIVRVTQLDASDSAPTEQTLTKWVHLLAIRG